MPAPDPLPGQMPLHSVRVVLYLACPVRPTPEEIAAEHVPGKPVNEVYAERAAKKRNLRRAKRWLKWLVELLPDVAVLAPWLPYVEALDENVHRERGIRDMVELMRGSDGIFLSGGRLSTGMHAERTQMVERVGGAVIDLSHVKEPPPRKARGPLQRRLVEEIVAAINAVPRIRP